MISYLLVAVGSGLGGMARHGLNEWIGARLPGLFPWGTLAVNVAGCFLAGWLAGIPEARLSAPGARLFLSAGFLGGFTTFSAFSVQTLLLAQNGRIGSAGLYVLASVALSLGGAWLGWMSGPGR